MILRFSFAISYGLLESLHIFVAMFRPRYTLSSTYYTPTYPPILFYSSYFSLALGVLLHILLLISRFQWTNQELESQAEEETSAIP